MIKMISGALIGLFIIGLGIYVWYYYITTLVAEGNHSLFVLSMIQIGVGVYILFRASKSTEPVISDAEIVPTTTVESESILKRNDEMLKEWHKNADFKDKLKILGDASDKWSKKEPFKG